MASPTDQISSVYYYNYVRKWQFCAYGKRKYIVPDSPKTPLSTDDENTQE